MKDRVIAHLVNATTRHARLVTVCAAVLCVLSVLASLLFLDADLTFKGMIGSGVKVVDAYDRVIRDFKVSGVITVALEPQNEERNRVRELNRKIDQFVFENLGEQGGEQTIAFLKEYAAGGFQTLSDRSTIRITVELMGLLDDAALGHVLENISSLTDEERQLIASAVGYAGTDARTMRAVSRKLQNLPRADVASLIAVVDELPQEERNLVVGFTLPHLSVFDKRSLLEASNKPTPARKLALCEQIDSTEQELESIHGEFNKKAQAFAAKLRETLVTGSPGEKGGPPLNEVVKAVLYSDDFSISSDQLMYLIMVSPQKNIDEMANAKEFTRVTDRALAGMKAAHPELRVRRTGFAAVQMDAQDAMFTDFGIMMVITAIGILLVFLLGLKSVGYPLLSMIPLTVGVLIMFGLYSFVGTLNLFSMMTPIILFGLGIDYAIHFGSRYGEVRLELGPSAPQAEILTRTFNSIGPGLFIAATTTVFAFLALTTSTINGFAEAGIMAGSGVVSAFSSMMYLLPILVTWRESRFKKTGVHFLKSRKYLRLGRFVQSPFGIAAAALILALAVSSIVFLPKIGMERDGMKLTPQVESVTLSKDLEEKFNFTDVQSYIILNGYDNLKKFRREVGRKEEGSAAYPAINASRVMDARKAIRTFEKLGWDRDIDTLARYKEMYAGRTTMMGNPNENIAELYDFIVRNYVDWESDEYLVIVPPSGFVWDSDLTDMYLSDLEILEDKFSVESAGFIHIWKWLLDHMMGDLLRSSLAAFVLMLLIVLVTMRSIRATLICSTTMLISFVSTLSIVGMLGIKFNYVNVISFPLIIGLGIDYIVHIYHRLVHTEKGDIVGAVSSTGKAVLLTTLTTLMAFGTISFSVHRGLAQTGIITCIGLTMALLSSLFIIPTLVKLTFKGGFPRQKKGNE